MARRPRASAADDHMVTAFLSAADDTFTENFFRDALFTSQEEARRTWPHCRRAVWAQTPRMRLPRPAEVFDALTRDGWEALWSTRNHITFPLADALAAIDRDRGAVVAFERSDPKGARAIADYLMCWREDLGTLQEMAYLVAGDSYAAGVHEQMATSRTYGAGADAA